MEKLNIVFFGRLEKEKGFDIVLDFLDYIQKNNDELINNIRIFILGKGSLEYNLKNLIGYNNYYKEENFDKNKLDDYGDIIYFGRRDRQFIDNILSTCHVSLMPSRFLETFGLSALESLNKGVPVIGFNKGGLRQFIFQKFSLGENNSYLDIYKVLESINNGEVRLSYYSEKSLEISKKYKLDKWKERFYSIVGDYNKLLIVSDYITNIGGIEKYIQEVGQILSNQGKSIKKVGYYGKVFTLHKFLFLVFSGFNFIYYFIINKTIKSFKPDIIWFHSVSRFLGWLSLFSVNNFNGKKIMMYHDFGYFHPFPSKVYYESQLKGSFTLKNFIKSSNSKNPLKIFFVILKFFSLLLLKKYLKKNIDIHLVPSQFMVDILKEKYEIPEKNIYVLPHFID